MGTLHLLRKQDNRHLRAVQPRTGEFASAPFLSTQARVQAREAEPGKRIVLSLGHSMTQGIPVTLQLGNEGELPEICTTGWLPPVSCLIAAYEKWQQTYQQIFANGAEFANRLSAPAVQVTNVSYRETINACYRSEKVLTNRINQWLNSALFRPVRETLLAYCHPRETIRLIVQTDDLQIQKLPLHRWDWFDRYLQAELVLSSATCKYSADVVLDCDLPLRVLAVLGDRRNLNTDCDLALLENIPNATVTCLREPTRSRLTETLYDFPWDIVLFAGHSDHSAQPKFCLNAEESLSLSELKCGLRKAIAQNLKLLILNTCDSLSLLRALGNDLQLPATVVMRSPVPDPVAQTFLRYFLTAFSQGQTLPQSVREAREKLQGIEHNFPFASWIPALYQTL